MMMIGIIITDKGSPTVSTCTGWGSAGETLIITYFSHSVCILQKIGLALGRRRTGCGGFSSPLCVAGK